jgi:hypothetical protein
MHERGSRPALYGLLDTSSASHGSAESAPAPGLVAPHGPSWEQYQPRRPTPAFSCCASWLTSGRVAYPRQAGVRTHIPAALVLSFLQRDVRVDIDDHGICLTARGRRG